MFAVHFNLALIPVWCKEGVSNLQLWTQILNVALTEKLDKHKYKQKLLLKIFKDLSDFILAYRHG